MKPCPPASGATPPRPNNNGGGQSPGFIVAGYTKSPNLIGANDPEQLYLIKTNTNRITCESLDPDVYVHYPNLGPTSAMLDTIHVTNQCGQWREPTTQTWVDSICHDTTTSAPSRRNDGGGDGIASVDAPADGAAITSYPNPIARGASFNVRYAVATRSTASITVSNEAGRMMYSLTGAYDAGTHLMPVSTGVWPAGAYFVTVTANGESLTHKIIVVER
jgi:hypothetical protein